MEFSPSSAVPGEEATLQVTAQPDSLCGVSIVDLSVLIKEPGKTLDKDKVTSGKHSRWIIYCFTDCVPCYSGTVCNLKGTGVHPVNGGQLKTHLMRFLHPYAGVHKQF